MYLDICIRYVIFNATFYRSFTLSYFQVLTLFYFYFNFLHLFLECRMRNVCPNLDIQPLRVIQLHDVRLMPACMSINQWTMSYLVIW